MPWAVVEFVESEEVEAVPQNWLNRPSGVGQDRVFCWWPPQKSQKIKHLIFKEVDISGVEGANNYEVRVLGDGYGKLHVYL